MLNDGMRKAGWIDFSGVGMPDSARGNKVYVLLRSGREIGWMRSEGVTWNTTSTCDQVMAYKVSRTVAQEAMSERDSPLEFDSVKSDGGSTSYYELTLPKHVQVSIEEQQAAGCTELTIETGDVIEMLVGNDFDAGNIIKALRRIFEAKKGKGKAGVEQTYDIKKCHYFVDEVEKKL